jgi:alpha-galactosidase
LLVPGRPRLLGRNQMVLDLSRKDVRDYLADAIFAILAE